MYIFVNNAFLYKNIAINLQIKCNKNLTFVLLFMTISITAMKTN
jgi:hypothetical protein